MKMRWLRHAMRRIRKLFRSKGSEHSKIRRPIKCIISEPFAFQYNYVERGNELPSNHGLDEPIGYHDYYDEWDNEISKSGVTPEPTDYQERYEQPPMERDAKLPLSGPMGYQNVEYSSYEREENNTMNRNKNSTQTTNTSGLELFYTPKSHVSDDHMRGDGRYPANGYRYNSNDKPKTTFNRTRCLDLSASNFPSLTGQRHGC